MAQYDDINAAAVSVAGIVSVIITFVIIVGSEVLYYQYQEIEKERKYSEFPGGPSAEILTEQQEALNSYGWIDREKKIVSQPIQLSIDKVLGELGSTEGKK